MILPAIQRCGLACAPRTTNPVLRGTGFLRGATLIHPDVSGPMYLADRSGPLCGEGTVRSALTWHVTAPTVETYPPLVFKGSGSRLPGPFHPCVWRRLSPYPALCGLAGDVLLPFSACSYVKRSICVSGNGVKDISVAQ